MIHMVKGFSIVGEAEVDVFWNSFAQIHILYGAFTNFSLQTCQSRL